MVVYNMVGYNLKGYTSHIDQYQMFLLASDECWKFHVKCPDNNNNT